MYVHLQEVTAVSRRDKSTDEKWIHSYPRQGVGGKREVRAMTKESRVCFGGVRKRTNIHCDHVK